MTAESFLHSRKYFVFHDSSGHGFCIIIPYTGQTWYGSALGPEGSDINSADTVECPVSVYWTSLVPPENLIPEASDSTHVMAKYTYYGNGSATLALTGMADANLVNAPSVLYGTAYDNSVEDSSSNYAQTELSTNMTGVITIYFQGDLKGTYVGRAADETTSATGDVRLWRGNTN